MTQTLNDLVLGPPKILLYGEAGTGKTAFATTAGRGTLVCDFDNGLVTAKTFKDKWQSERLQITPKLFHETAPGKAVAWRQAREFIPSLCKDIHAKKPDAPQVLVLDSLTTLAESVVRYILDNSGRLGSNPEIQHWGLAFIEIENLLSTLRALPIVVVLIAHEQTKTLDQIEYTEIMIAGKKLPDKIPAFFDEVWYSRVKNEAGGKQSYRIQTKRTATVMSRSRRQVPDNFVMDDGLRAALISGGYELPKREEVKPQALATPVAPISGVVVKS